MTGDSIGNIFISATNIDGETPIPFIAKFDNSLTLLSIYSYPEDLEMVNMITDESNNIIAVGSYRNEPSNNSCVVKFDNNLNLINIYKYEFPINDGSFGHIDYHNNAYYIAGIIMDGSIDAITISIVKLDDDLNVLETAMFTHQILIPISEFGSEMMPEPMIPEDILISPLTNRLYMTGGCIFGTFFGPEIPLTTCLLGLCSTITDTNYSFNHDYELTELPPLTRSSINDITFISQDLTFYPNDAFSIYSVDAPLTPVDLSNTLFSNESYICAVGLEADFYAEPDYGCAHLYVQFYNESIGIIDSYLWNFGDGRTSTDENPLHIYRQPGRYTVSLTVYGVGGEASVTYENLIFVKPCPRFSQDIMKTHHTEIEWFSKK
jgi:hypothetical protein